MSTAELSFIPKPSGTHLADCYGAQNHVQCCAFGSWYPRVPPEVSDTFLGRGNPDVDHIHTRLPSRCCSPPNHPLFRFDDSSSMASRPDPPAADPSDHHSQQSTAHYTMPKTQFATAYNADGNPDLASVDWVQVAVREPEQVVDWIQLMYPHEPSRPQACKQSSPPRVSTLTHVILTMSSIRQGLFPSGLLLLLPGCLSSSWTYFPTTTRFLNHKRYDFPSVTVAVISE